MASRRHSIHEIGNLKIVMGQLSLGQMPNLYNLSFCRLVTGHTSTAKSNVCNFSQMLSIAWCTSLGIQMGRPRNLMVGLAMKGSFWPERVSLGSTYLLVDPRKDTAWHLGTLASILAHPNHWSVVFSNLWQAAGQLATRQMSSAYCKEVIQYAELFRLELQGVNKGVDYSVEDHLIVGHLDGRLSSKG